MLGIAWPYLSIFGLGTGELVLILLFIVIIFGAKKIPELAQGMGKGIREFKKAMKDTEEEIKSDVKDDNSKKLKPDDKHNG
jgi:sec-independent protein translocase protein TatA